MIHVRADNRKYISVLIWFLVIFPIPAWKTGSNPKHLNAFFLNYRYVKNK